MNVIDLFSGCGGLSRGFMDAGFNVLVGVDNTKIAIETFEKNHEGGKGLELDLSNFESFNEIKNVVKDNKIDVIVAGPPCQGFSLSGPRNFEDDRNKLYQAVIESVKIFEPEVFVIENVPGMATLYKGAVKDEIVKRFKKLGYNVENRVLNAADFGVPQVRKRLFFVGVKKKYGKFRFPDPAVNVDRYVSCEQAINDLPTLEDGIWSETMEYKSAPSSEYQRNMRKKCKYVHNHIGTRHTELVISVIKQVPEGGNHKDLPEGVGESRKFNEAWTRYHSKKPSKTIDTGHRNHFHYKYNRVPTVRENARLQSFSDDFIFLGNKTEQYRQVGNAVPPLLGYHIAKAILDLLGEQDD